MASNTDDTFANYKKIAGFAIGGVLLAAIMDSCTAPSKEDIAEAKAASEAVVKARRAAVENPGAEAEENLKPVEKLAVVEKAAEPGPARDGAAVYQSACMACHAAGVMEAPKLEAGAWDNRIHKGLDGLTTSAINGINNMPARGGNPAISDEEMENAVAYMLAESGYDPNAEAKSADAEEAKPTIDPAVMEEIKAAAAEAKAAAAEAKISATEARTAADEAQASITGAAAAMAAVGAGAATMAATTEVAQAEPAADSLGKQVYDTTCFTCHDVGIFGSPVLTDKAAWNDRIGAGIDALYATAIKGNGTNTKPAMGGHPDLSEAQVKAAVDYMLDTAGVDMSADTGAATATQAAEATEAKAEEAPAAEATQESAEETQAAAEEKTEAAEATETATEEKTEAAQEEAPAAETTEAAQEEAPAAETTEAAQEEAPAAEATEAAQEEAPAAEATEVAQEEAPAAEVTEAAQESTETAQPAAEEKTEAAEATETATEEKTEAAQEEAPAAEEKSEEAEATDAEQKTEAAPAAEVKQEATAAAAPSWASIDGEKVYQSICFSCHATGVAQAPVVGKATAWEARIAAGMDTLYNNSINGKGIMPARGGNPTLSDDEIKAAVDWMVQQSQ